MVGLSVDHLCLAAIGVGVPLDASLLLCW